MLSFVFDTAGHSQVAYCCLKQTFNKKKLTGDVRKFSKIALTYDAHSLFCEKQLMLEFVYLENNQI